MEPLWQGVKTVLACGTTGEFSSLTLNERKSIVELCVANFHGEGLSVISHVSCCAIDDTLELCSHAKHVGCDAVLVLPPFYYHNALPEVSAHQWFLVESNPDPSAQGIEAFLSAVLSRCQLPAFLYNFPKHSGNIITPEMYARLAQLHPAVLAGIKVRSRRTQSYWHQFLSIDTASPRSCPIHT